VIAPAGSGCTDADFCAIIIAGRTGTVTAQPAARRQANNKAICNSFVIARHL